MSTSALPWAVLVHAMLQARPLSPEQAAEVAAAFRRAIYDDEPLDGALGFPPRWRLAVRLQERRHAAQASAGDGDQASARERVRELHKQVRRYRSAGYDIDVRRREPPAGPRGMWFRLLNANRGKVPSEGALRNWVGQASELASTIGPRLFLPPGG